MTEEKKLIEEKNEGGLSHPAPHHKGLTRRQALFGALLGIGAVAAKSAKAAEESCACLAPPNCDAVCPNGEVLAETEHKRAIAIPRPSPTQS